MKAFKLSDFESFLVTKGLDKSPVAQTLTTLKENYQVISNNTSQALERLNHGSPLIKDEDFHNLFIRFMVDVKERIILLRQDIEDSNEEFDREIALDVKVIITDALSRLIFLESHRKFIYKAHKDQYPLELIEMLDSELREATTLIPFFEDSLKLITAKLEAPEQASVSQSHSVELSNSENLMAPLDEEVNTVKNVLTEKSTYSGGLTLFKNSSLSQVTANKNDDTFSDDSSLIPKQS